MLVELVKRSVKWIELVLEGFVVVIVPGWCCVLDCVVVTSVVLARKNRAEIQESERTWVGQSSVSWQSNSSQISQYDLVGFFKEETVVSKNNVES